MQRRGPSAFDEKVYDATRMIPRGRVSTYAIIGRIIGCRSPRAVGQALGRNPYGLEVPCHRVISSSLSLGGFGNEQDGPETKRKAKLLAAEGVTFDTDTKLADPQKLWTGL